MMDKENLRKADFFSGSLVTLFGIFVVVKSLGMPMKDSWGGVQNVWYVSPAIFPLFVGSMLVLLGSMLIRTALKTIGSSGVKAVFQYLMSTVFRGFLRSRETVRFYGILLLLLSFVFLMVPRVDFFLAATLFLLAFFCMFYLDRADLLIRLMLLYCIGMIALLLVLLLSERLSAVLQHPGDWFVLVFSVLFAVIVRIRISGNREIGKKYTIALLLAVAAPFLIGIIFKYFLLVPMPYEGLIIELLDVIWYAEIWG
ncbi:MAG: hypothetical protein V2I36_11220 [Desulfopila sp.]|jgi:hypothetical protein|nr:hypothetical protein [Desulfopila sp.]